jgi:hypothetical protein
MAQIFVFKNTSDFISVHENFFKKWTNIPDDNLSNKKYLKAIKLFLPFEV